MGLRPAHLLLLAGLVAGLVAGCDRASPAAPADRAAATGALGERPRNLLFLSVDTLRADHLGCYGYDRPTSPTVDALAARGALFETVTATAPWTVPSHFSMVTGLYARSHGVRSTRARLPATVETLAERLAAHGWRTGAIVNFGVLGNDRGFDRGFEAFATVRPAWDERGAAGHVAQRAVTWLEGIGDEPFFLFLHFYDVHSDYRARKSFLERFTGDYRGPVNGTTQQLKAFRAGQRGTWDDADRRHLIDLYDAGLCQLDADLESLLEKLRARGLEEDTLVVLTSDHGEEFLEHGDVLHSRTLFEEVVHVPLILAGPGVPVGVRVAGDASLVDLAPTVCALLGVPPIEGVEGVDLTAAWRAPDAWPPARPVFSEADAWHDMREGDRRRSARMGRYKLVHDHLDERSRLFDLESDPDELQDVSAELPELLVRMQQELEAFRAGRAADAEAIELSPEDARSLEDLGYF